MLAAFGIGGAVGSFAMSSIKMPRRYLTVLLLGWGLSGLPFIADRERRHHLDDGRPRPA